MISNIAYSPKNDISVLLNLLNVIQSVSNPIKGLITLHLGIDDDAKSNNTIAPVFMLKKQLTKITVKLKFFVRVIEIGSIFEFIFPYHPMKYHPEEGVAVSVICEY